MAKKNPDNAYDKRDIDITREGEKIILPALPEPMTIPAAIKALKRKQEEEETIMDVREIIDAYPTDAAVAFVTAMRRKYGWASPTPKMSFFGPIAPDLLTVKVGPGPKDTVQVPWGDFTLPGIENPISTYRHMTKAGPALLIAGSVRKKEFHVVKELAELTREILKENSIYRGKAIRLRVNYDGDLDHENDPDFIETDHVVSEELVLNDGEWDQLKTALWSPIENTEACLQHKIPLKRGVLLEGDYGTGKTMSAMVTSKVCVENEWTFVLLDDVRALAEALRFAKRYEPAVVFAEDVDRIVSERDEQGNDLLNTIDGVLSKNSKVITVLTTNHVERLEKAMLRPGRLDSVISVFPPDANSVQRLLRIYGRGLIAEEETLDQAGDALAGHIPATVREVVERSKLAMISRGGQSVREPDLLVAAEGMKRHLELLQKVPPVPTAGDRLADAFRDVLGNNGLDDEDVEALEGISDNISRQVSQFKGVGSQIIRGVSSAAKSINDKSEKVHTEVKKVRQDTSALRKHFE